jgi:signal transduction histidine kinase
MTAMKGWQLRPLPIVLFGVTLATELAAILLSWGLESRYDTVLYAVYSVSLAGAGALIASRQSHNPIGWLFCSFALLNAVAADVAQGWALRAAEEGWRFSDAAAVLAYASWQPSGLGWVLTFLLFPDGHLPSRRWRIVIWAAAVGTALAVPGWSLSAGAGAEFPSGRNPIAVEGLPTDAFLAVGMTLLIGALAASVLSLVRRFRRAQGIERQQLKWFSLAGVVAAIFLPLGFALWFVTPLAGVLIALALTALPVAACIAILRYRLYDIDVVINRTLVYAALTMLLAATFAVTAFVLGIALGRGSAWATAGATLVVAAAFLPLRRRVQDAIDRRFNRARYDAVRRMTSFLEDLHAGRAAPEAIEGVLQEALADPRLELHFYLPESELYVDTQGMPATDPLDDGRVRVPLERAGQPLGLVLHDAGSTADPTLLARVVQAGGLGIEIARLRVELHRQLKQVEASRARILLAGDDERRRIERDLHDGAQQRLVSVGLALRHAQHELDAGATRHARATLDDAVSEIESTVDDLRELARGLRPAQLDAGLAAALRELARRAPLPVEVQATGERFADSVETAAYFIACEGLTNAIKHAQASKVILSAAPQNGNLIVGIADDGVGGAAPANGSGLAGIADRIAAQGGTLRIESRPGEGTSLTAELPCAS